jgi:ribosomal protein S9
MAVIRKGSGRLYINGLPVEVFAPNEFVRMKILEPLWWQWITLRTWIYSRE